MAWWNKTFKWVTFTGVNKHGLVPVIIHVPVAYNMISIKTKIDVSYPPLSCQGN